MKYIRTKDGYLLEVIRESESKKSYITKPNGWVIHKDRVIKQADTIEELCDRFVYVPKGKKDSWISIFVDLPNNLKEEKDYYYYTYNIYGAIWTDKGLIYVAMMNDKGELELS